MSRPLCSSTRTVLHHYFRQQQSSLGRHEGVKRCLTRSAVLSNAPQQQPRKPRIVLSGIQPTGIPHLGNYLGALSNWVKLQKDASPDDELFFSIVGWHALTLPQNPAALREARSDMLAILLAIGLDPERSIIFHQDHNQDHVELGWIFDCVTPTGKLRRMTTWKTRLAASRNAGSEDEVDESLLNAGLFTYPILQAADILAYKATHVPVGEDQQQHLELTRDIAEIFNRNFSPSPTKPIFPLPEFMNTPSKRILSLSDPTSKMSKSAPDTSSRILLTDSPFQISKKLKRAVTDSIRGITYDPVARPGTSNLLTILAACLDKDVHEVAVAYASKGHGELKSDVADAVESVFKGPRKEFERIRGEKAYLEEVARKGAERARERSGRVIKEVRQALGLS
ncbi:tryptophanyl-tRNA synthetase [Coniophora puteana RWD-64-598 SS2]|uniref:tryptophan--tRNA ligase n=1 Tax=Coniophora puteana (strain RWD-64-598) TaxID=741705 RepID=A0A5M3N2M4_CONPW|nr:tryptophanyl-tRNA synthetase [Coniophora puteana RWD-64-598 SS2]EIW85642.1 tryptophanyl-tRNA synthetase [Coniophora puteana RWD-64-598 SS2]